MGDRCRLGFALAKEFVRELTHVAEVTECADLIETLCTSVADQNLSANLRSTVPFFVLSRTPVDACYSALFLSNAKATIHIFYDKQVEFPLLTDARRQGRRGQPLSKSPSPTAATRGTDHLPGQNSLSLLRETAAAGLDPKTRTTTTSRESILTPGWEALERRDS